MKRRHFFVIPLLFLASFFSSAQESADQMPLADAVDSSQTAGGEEDGSAAELSSESTESSESPEKGSDASKSKREKIKELYSEYQEKSSEVRKSQRISAFQFVGDFITDKLPLTLDLGAEPGEHGSTVFGALQYDWSQKVASRIRLEYQSLKTSTDASNLFSTTIETSSGETSAGSDLSGDWITMTKSRQIEVDFYPYLRYFGDADRRAKTPFVYFGLGAFYLFNWYDLNYGGILETTAQRGIFKIDVEGYYHQFGPIAIGSIKVPFLKYFGFSLETTFSPINRVISASDNFSTGYILNTETKSITTNSQSNSTDDAHWCSPLLKVDLAIDVFTYFRLRTRFDFSRIYVGSLKEVNLLGSFNTDENRSETYKWRYGAEIVFPSSNRTRKKNSHLWAGVYYEHQWDAVTTNGSTNTTHSGKWIFCFGK